MSRTQCRSTVYQKEAQGRTVCVAVRPARPLTMAHPIRPQLYFRRRDEMYASAQTSETSRAPTPVGGGGWAGGAPGLLAFWPFSGLLTNPESRPATWIRLGPGRCSSGYVPYHAEIHSNHSPNTLDTCSTAQAKAERASPTRNSHVFHRGLP